MLHVTGTKLRAEGGKALRSARTAGVGYVDRLCGTACVALAYILDRKLIIRRLKVRNWLKPAAFKGIKSPFRLSKIVQIAQVKKNSDANGTCGAERSCLPTASCEP